MTMFKKLWCILRRHPYGIHTLEITYDGVHVCECKHCGCTLRIGLDWKAK